MSPDVKLVWSVWGVALCHSIQIAFGLTCAMDPGQLTLAALIWCTKTATAEEDETLLDKTEDGTARDVQDPLGLKQSIFIATPIVLVGEYK